MTIDKGLEIDAFNCAYIQDIGLVSGHVFEFLRVGVVWSGKPPVVKLERDDISARLLGV